MWNGVDGSYTQHTNPPSIGADPARQVQNEESGESQSETDSYSYSSESDSYSDSEDYSSDDSSDSSDYSDSSFGSVDSYTQNNGQQNFSSFAASFSSRRPERSTEEDTRSHYGLVRVRRATRQQPEAEEYTLKLDGKTHTL